MVHYFVYQVNKYIPSGSEENDGKQLLLFINNLLH